jgi:hypothetical protein
VSEQPIGNAPHVNAYRYAVSQIRVHWSAEDREFVATTEQFPSLSVLDTDPAKAFSKLTGMVLEVLASGDEFRSASGGPDDAHEQIAQQSIIIERLDQAIRDAAELIEGIDSWKDWHTEEARDALLAWLARPEVVDARRT